MQSFDDNNDLGFELLMNTNNTNIKKKSSDNISISSSKSSVYGKHKASKASSVKSFDQHPNPNFVDVKQHMNLHNKASNEEESVLSYEITSEEESVDFQSSAQPKHHTKSKEKYCESASESEYEEGSVVSKHKVSEEDVLSEKKEMLYQFDRLEKKGIRLPRKYTMASNLEEMKSDYERLKRDKEVDSSVKFQRRMVMAFASGVEYLNDKFDPFDVKLSGWSEKVHEDIDDYDEVFEDLHNKYKSKAKVAPELKLVFMMGSSAFMFHLTNSMFKTSLPGLDQVLKQNPELMKQFAAATANTMAAEQKKTNGPFGGLASMFGSMFGGGGGGGGGASVPNVEQQSGGSSERGYVHQQRMKGPSNIDDILNELNLDSNNDRIEMMSTVTESELFDLPDDGSINGLLMNTKKGSKKGSKKNKVSLDL